MSAKPNNIIISHTTRPPLLLNAIAFNTETTGLDTRKAGIIHGIYDIDMADKTPGPVTVVTISSSSR